MKVRGALKRSFDSTYDDPETGRWTRKDLRMKFADSVQMNLALSSRYSVYDGAELIMRAVGALLDPTFVEDSKEYILSKLENGLLRIGYFLVPDDGQSKPKEIVPVLYISGAISRDVEKHYSDAQTGQRLTLRDLRTYLDVLDRCLSQSEDNQCDRAARCLVQAVRLLLDTEPDWRTREAENLLWAAAKELGYRLEITEWYKTQIAASQN